MCSDRVMLVIVVRVVPEGVAVLRCFMAMTQLDFVGELFMVFLAEERFTMTFRFLRSRLHSRRPRVDIGDKVVAGEVDSDWRLLSDMVC